MFQWYAQMQIAHMERGPTGMIAQSNVEVANRNGDVTSSSTPSPAVHLVQPVQPGSSRAATMSHVVRLARMVRLAYGVNGAPAAQHAWEASVRDHVTSKFVQMLVAILLMAPHMK